VGEDTAGILANFIQTPHETQRTRW
jgi:hypothetical protein